MSKNPIKYCKLESIARVRSGLSSRDIEYSGSEGAVFAKVIASSALTSPFLTKIDGEKVALTGPTATRHDLQQDDIVTSSRITFRTSILEDLPEVMSGGFPLVAGPLCMVIRVNNDNLDEVYPAYLAWILSTECISKKMVSAARGSSALIFSRESLATLEVPLLPYAEQVKIAKMARDAIGLHDARCKEASLEFALNTEELSNLVGLR